MLRKSGRTKPAFYVRAKNIKTNRAWKEGEMVSWEFFIDAILLAALWPWV